LMKSAFAFAPTAADAAAPPALARESDLDNKLELAAGVVVPVPLAKVAAFVVAEAPPGLRRFGM